MSKTRINYLYRDADNYKKYNSVVVPGVFTEDEKQRIIDSLDGVYFVPDAVGFPEERFDHWDDQTDGGYFEFCDFEETDAEPTIDMTPEQIVAAFEANKDNWEQLANDRFMELAEEWEKPAVPPTPTLNKKKRYALLVANGNEFRFVTKLSPGNHAEWLSGEPMQLWESRSFASEIATGLYLNGTPAFVVEVPSQLAEIKNY